MSELEYEQVRSRKTEQNTKLMRENEALAAEVEQLKKTLQGNMALHDEAMLTWVNEIVDLELQLLEKKATDAGAWPSTPRRTTS